MGRTARNASHDASADLRAGEVPTNLMTAGPSGPVRLSNVVQRDDFCYALVTGHLLLGTFNSTLSTKPSHLELFNQPLLTTPFLPDPFN